MKRIGPAINEMVFYPTYTIATATA